MTHAALRTRVGLASAARDRRIDGDPRADRERALRSGLDDHAADLVAHLERERDEGCEGGTSRLIREHRVEVRAADSAARDLHARPRGTGQSWLWFLDERDRKVRIREVEL